MYVHDSRPGIRRKKKGKKFEYITPAGKVITDEKTLHRIRSLIIPPAWKNVWICTQSNGHLQATGLDNKNRKQYRYHPQWRAVRDQTKYDRMLSFGKALPKIRRQVKKDLTLLGLPREKIIAVIICVMEKTLIRVGNETYAKENHSYGLTTMLQKHVAIHGTTIRFHFKGKSGVTHTIELHDRRLAKIIQKCHELPGHELFEYSDVDDKLHGIDSSHVNDYLQKISGGDFTAKDFRTWHGSVLAAETLKSFAESGTESQAKKNLVQAIEIVAEKLGNTKAVCKKCYIHPKIIEAYLDHSLLKNMRVGVKSFFSHMRSLLPEEVALMAFLSR